MYERSRHISTFYVAGFQFWDGACVLGELKAGDRLELVPEPDNPHDPDAIALYFNGCKLGFVPAGENELLACMCHFGYTAAFEVRVLQVSPERSPWHQVRVGIFIVDARS